MQYLKSINIKKIRHLKNLNISLEANEIKHLIITGKNGSGKTSILEAISKILFVPFNNISSNKGENDLLEIKFDENILKIKDNFIFGYLKDYRKLDLAISNGPNKNLVNDENDDKTYLFVQYLVNMKTEGLFAKQDGNIQESNKIDSWFRLFEGFLKKIFEDENLVLKFDYKKYDFIIELADKKSFNIRNASAGYSAVLKIVAEIMFLMELDRLNYDKPGIVMIDELETHLHVTLQKMILPMLISFFPNIQFIITTHSPFIINSCKNCIVYDLEKQVQVEDLSAYSYESIIENYFDVDKYSNEIKDKIERYEFLIKKDTLNDNELSEKNDLKFYIEGLIGEELVLKIKELQITQKIREMREKVD
jgi:predicted ATP-binding protein involved in virulence